MKVVVVNAYGHSNRGDSVLLDECLSDLRAAYGDNATISVCLFDDFNGYKDKSVKYLERIGNLNISNKLLAILGKMSILLITLLVFKFNLRFLTSLLPAKQRDTVESLFSADVIVSAPGGYLHDTNFAYIIALLHIQIGIWLAKNTYLAPQSIGPINSSAGRLITKTVLGKCSGVCVREGYTYDFLIALGVDSDIIHKTGDSAFWNENICEEYVNEDLKAIGVEPGVAFVGMTLVDWTFPGSNKPQELKFIYAEKIARLIDDVYSEFKLITVVFNQVTDDVAFAKEIENILKNREALIVDDVERSASRLRGMIARSTVFVGTRFHSCIFSLSSSVPTSAISYLPKTEYILKDFGFESKSFDIRNIDYDQLKAQVFHDINCLPSETARTKEYLDRYRKNMKQFVGVING